MNHIKQNELNKWKTASLTFKPETNTNLTDCTDSRNKAQPEAPSLNNNLTKANCNGRIPILAGQVSNKQLP